MPSLDWRAGRRPGQRRGIPIASRPGVATTRVEAAPGRRFPQIEDGTGDALQRLTPLGDGVDEPGRVRVFGGGEYRIRTTHFHQLGSVENRCPRAKLRHHGQIMGDKQERQFQVPLKFPEQGQDLGLDRNVNRGCGFVGDQQ